MKLTQEFHLIEHRYEGAEVYRRFASKEDAINCLQNLPFDPIDERTGCAIRWEIREYYIVEADNA